LCLHLPWVRAEGKLLRVPALSSRSPRVAGVRLSHRGGANLRSLFRPVCEDSPRPTRLRVSPAPVQNPMVAPAVADMPLESVRPLRFGIDPWWSKGMDGPTVCTPSLIRRERKIHRRGYSQRQVQNLPPPFSHLSHPSVAVWTTEPLRRRSGRRGTQTSSPFERIETLLTTHPGNWYNGPRETVADMRTSFSGAVGFM